ncbi:hypothetical protein AD935_03365 [Gluconobacter japonicus]|nr:hypothetical protein AD935_03365 [Gluconobacter japonicus]
MLKSARLGAAGLVTSSKYFPRLWISQCSVLIWTRVGLIQMGVKADLPFDAVLMFKILVIQTLNNNLR